MPLKIKARDHAMMMLRPRSLASGKRPSIWCLDDTILKKGTSHLAEKHDRIERRKSPYSIELSTWRALMLHQRLIGQPGITGKPVKNVDAIIELINSGASTFDSAVAYVTDSGVDALLRTIWSYGADPAWSTLKKRFLVGVDWYRTDPTALERLSALPATIRVHDGSRVIARKGCVPFTPWHPKWFSTQGPTGRGQLIGSGNLSRNGLMSGHEAGLLQIVADPANEAERLVEDTIRSGHEWFERMWQGATPLSTVIDQYRRGFEALPKGHVGRNDDVADGSGRVGTRNRLSADQLASLASATNFWIEGGTLTRNRGPARSGNQLMMSALMRVFFGSPAIEVPRNTAVGSATIEHPQNKSVIVNSPIRFSDNSMDVITLPVPELPWPTSYDDSVLLFTKVSRGDRLHYALTVRPTNRAGRWRSASSTKGTRYSMRSGRRWGVFG